MNSTAFLSCDWGTSSFRLRWIEPGLVVGREHTSAIGCKALHDRAKASGGERASAYEWQLTEVLRDWERFARDPLPLVISGMASSTIGWREVPYLEGALRLDGSNLRFETIRWNQPVWISQTYLISGVAIHPEMMRGEEVEAIGILSALQRDSATLILPGTHSKHLHIENGQVADIATYMTGELFEVLARHSILNASLDLGAPQLDHNAFDEGVCWAAEHGLERSLFRVRTRAVLDRCPHAANTWFLSGLLIGAELVDLVEKSPAHILLAGAGQFAELYARALNALKLEPSCWSAVPPDVVKEAVPRAHALFLKTHL